MRSRRCNAQRRCGHLRHPLRLLALTASLAACGELPAPDVGRSESALVNGRADARFPSVGRLLRGSTSSAPAICTATLVGDRTVVTAAHCVKAGALQFQVAGARHAVVSASKHPAYDTADGAIVNDVAVLRLASAPNVMPSTLASAAPARGELVTLVGYGATSADKSGGGTKRSALHPVDQLTATELRYDGVQGSYGNICNGDSGGPTFALVDAGYVQIGVHSSIVGDCGSSGQDTRIDVFLDWIAAEAGGDVYRDGQLPTRDFAPPTVTITAPRDGAVARTDLVVDARAIDDTGVVAVRLEIDGRPGPTLTEPPYSFPVAGLPPGIPTVLAVVAEDAAGNRGRAAIAVKPDLSAPVVAIIEPGAGSAVSPSTVVRAAASDDDRVVTVTLEMDGERVGTRTAPPWDFPVSLRYRVTRLSVVATDAAGNAAASAIEVIVPGAPDAPYTNQLAGCAVTGRAAGSPLPWLLLGLLVHGGRRRHRRRR